MTSKNWFKRLYADPTTTILSVNVADCEISVIRQIGLLGLPWCTIFDSAKCRNLDFDYVRSFMVQNVSRIGLQIDEFGTPKTSQFYPTGRHNREVIALLTGAANSLCFCNDQCPMLESYSKWSVDLQKVKRFGAVAGPVALHRAKLWLALCQFAIRFLEMIAGSQTSRYANRLRSACELYQELSETCLLPLVHLFERRTIKGACELLDKAHELATLGVELILEAALIELHLPVVVQNALMESPETTLSAQAVSELVYFARAGTEPLQMLARRRLSRTNDNRALALRN